MNRLNKNAKWLFATSFTFSLAAAPVYWDPLAGGNGHWYEPVRVEAGISWNDAKSAAEARGGYLVTITSESENLFVFDLIQSPTLWLGGYDSFANKTYYSGPLIGAYQPPGSAEPDGGWTWVNGGVFPS